MTSGRPPPSLAAFQVGAWLHLLGIGLFGALSYGQPRALVGWAGIPACGLYLAHGYAVNRYWDDVLAGRARRDPRRLLGCYVPFAAALLLAATIARWAVPSLLVGLLCSELYSAPWIRAKSLPGLDLVVNALCFVPLVFVGAAFAAPGPPIWAVWWRAALVALVFVPLQLIHELDDAAADRSDGVQTTVLRLGVRRSAMACQLALAAVVAAAIPLGIALRQPIGLPIATVLWAAGLTWLVRTRASGHERPPQIKSPTRVLSSAYGFALLMLT